MNITLKNDRLTVVISTMGAEIQSMTTAEGLELMWQADKAVWGRHAPLLFPIIGRLKDQQYTLDGQVISISQHGFARDTEFTLVRQDETSATFTMEDTETTRKVSLRLFPDRHLHPLRQHADQVPHRGQQVGQGAAL